MEIAKHKIPVSSKDYIKHLKRYLKIVCKKIEECNYTCEAGDLKMNKDWIELKSISA